MQAMMVPMSTVHHPLKREPWIISDLVVSNFQSGIFPSWHIQLQFPVIVCRSTTTNHGGQKDFTIFRFLVWHSNVCSSELTWCSGMWRLSELQSDFGDNNSLTVKLWSFKRFDIFRLILSDWINLSESTRDYRQLLRVDRPPNVDTRNHKRPFRVFKLHWLCSATANHNLPRHPISIRAAFSRFDEHRFWPRRRSSEHLSKASQWKFYWEWPVRRSS